MLSRTYAPSSKLRPTSPKTESEKGTPLTYEAAASIAEQDGTRSDHQRTGLAAHFRRAAAHPVIFQHSLSHLSADKRCGREAGAMGAGAKSPERMRHPQIALLCLAQAPPRGRGSCLMVHAGKTRHVCDARNAGVRKSYSASSVSQLKSDRYWYSQFRSPFPSWTSM